MNSHLEIISNLLTKTNIRLVERTLALISYYLWLKIIRSRTVYLGNESIEKESRILETKYTVGYVNIHLLEN